MRVTDQIADQLVGIVQDAALIYSLESDDEFVGALQQIRRELGAKCNARFPDASEEVSALVTEVMKLTAVRRHEIITGAGTLPPHGMMQ